jgi:hypothetical protein
MSKSRPTADDILPPRGMNAALEETVPPEIQEKMLENWGRRPFETFSRQFFAFPGQGRGAPA